MQYSPCEMCNAAVAYAACAPPAHATFNAPWLARASPPPASQLPARCPARGAFTATSMPLDRMYSCTLAAPQECIAKSRTATPNGQRELTSRARASRHEPGRDGCHEFCTWVRICYKLSLLRLGIGLGVPLPGWIAAPPFFRLRNPLAPPVPPWAAAARRATDLLASSVCLSARNSGAAHLRRTYFWRMNSAHRSSAVSGVGSAYPLGNRAKYRLLARSLPTLKSLQGNGAIIPQQSGPSQPVRRCGRASLRASVAA